MLLIPKCNAGSKNLSLYSYGILTWAIHRLDFTKDMHVLAMLQNSNIAKMMALVEEEPFGAIFEFGRFGDLLTFLESRGSNLDNKDDIRWVKY